MTQFHLHLVSDATGETLDALAKAALVQFEAAEPVKHSWNLIRTEKQMQIVFNAIDQYGGLVLFTLVNPDLRRSLQHFCDERSVPCIAVLGPIISALANFLGTKSRNLPGRQHMLDAEYFRRIEAMDFTRAHDDGQVSEALLDADVILCGVSRTSKTPTSIYLAHRGVKTANIPLVPGVPLPEVLDRAIKPLIVGLTANPETLIQIRRNRLLSLKQGGETDYVDLDAVKQELNAARRLYAERNWPVIDVTRRSIEETAALILNMLARRADQHPSAPVE